MWSWENARSLYILGIMIVLGTPIAWGFVIYSKRPPKPARRAPTGQEKAKKANPGKKEKK